jgi:hypothetical protein
LQTAEQPLPDALRQVLNLLVLQIPQSAHLTDAERLRQIMLDSGLWLEARLAQKQPVNPNTDMKANLLKLAQQLDQPDLVAAGMAENLRQELLDLQAQVKGGLSSLSLHQLQSLPQSEHHQVWHLSIPFQQAEEIGQLAIQIEREQQSDQAANPEDAWSVTLTLQPPGLATISCKITYAQQKINLYFKSDLASTAKIISHHCDSLKTALISAGLTVGYLDDQVGNTQPALRSQLAVSRLFDDQA